MNSVLYSILISLLLRMSIITVFVLIIKAAFRYRLSASMHSAIWMIVVIQCAFCIFGVRIQADTSIYNYITPETGAIIASGTEANGGFDIKNAAAFLWAAGALGLMLWYIFVYIRHRIEISRLSYVSDKRTLEIFSELKAELEIDSDIALRYGAVAETTPGTIIIPDGFGYEELRQIMLHELCHYKNRDCLKLWLSIAVVSLNWFNPLIWYAFRRFRTDIEMLCDDRVIKLTDSRKCYAAALVHSSMAKNRFIPGTTSLHNGKREVTERVKRLVSWKKKKPIWAVIATAACVGISCMCLTDAVTVAVENTVDIAATPEPISDISEVIPIPESTPRQEAPVEDIPQEDTPQEDYTTSDNYTAQDYEPDTNYSADADYSADDYSENYESYDEPSEPEENAEFPSIGAEREDVYDAMGEPESLSVNGTKEMYSLDDGTTAILQYEEDGTLEYGYIVEPSE